MAGIRRNKNEKVVRYFVCEVAADNCYAVYIVNETDMKYDVKNIVPAVVVDHALTGDIVDLEKFYDIVENACGMSEMAPHEYDFLVAGTLYWLPRNRKR